MSKEQLEEIEEPFADFEKIKTHMLKRKIRDGLDEFKRNKGQQWTELRFEKPLLDKLLSSIEQAERVQELEQKVRVDSELFDKQVQQNKRYREALEYIADNKIEHGWHLKAVNCVVRARKALESESSE